VRRLDRTVAIKVLPSESHPHIGALFDVGHDSGVDFLVSEDGHLESTPHRVRESTEDRRRRLPDGAADHR
jgi:hypothetical protein